MGFWKTFKQGAGLTAGMMAGATIGSVIMGAWLAVLKLCERGLGIDDKSSDEKEDESSTEEEGS